ncbi:helix-turn-helix transcriptional regulator [Bacillus haynesii]|uniref:helix-turn-helix transcriptional regulator n=1 Tax=Bacillus haynesii TaxID=1925021 RepID=UPI001592DBB3|nr:YafY family protein [Bacillus haynesii]NVB32003.1 YafY family transcriptional regulator [Bacillus licheniformis]MCY7780540.1 YafY family transcriptional regulator [Bacillus haynesii]MEC0668797.1 YafY family protein [Bacillus haynesii]MEC1417458.1 YafY family protein [Bacillus haynesii]MEC1470428.1 YafY family protein [Bacillus haynesii]
MNKTDRLLAIVLELQRKDVIRAGDLATQFETSVRTIYRDIQALCEGGVPIIGAPGTGYSLMEGYFLPPLSFTVQEAVSLLIGTDFIEQQFDDDYRANAQDARYKIEAILPESVLIETSRVRKVMRLLNSDKDHQLKEKEYLEKIRRAILEERKIGFHYFKKYADSEGKRYSVRTVSPYGLVLVEGSWMLVAQCDLRQEIRHFRLSRMTELINLRERFELPMHFKLSKYTPLDDRHLLVRIRFNHEIADKVKESNYHYIENMEDHQDGFHVVLRVRHLDEVLQWVLGWGADAIVLEPKSLQNRIREEAQKILKRY